MFNVINLHGTIIIQNYIWVLKVLDMNVHFINQKDMNIFTWARMIHTNKI